MRFQRLNQPATDFGIVLVDHSDGDLADDLAEIGLRIKECVEDRRQYEQAEHALVVQHAPPLGQERSGEAALVPVGRRFRFGRDREVATAERAEAQPYQQCQGEGERAKNGEWFRRLAQRNPARRLVEQDLDIPAQRQHGAPDARERPHSDHGKPDARIAERGRHDDGGEAEAQGQVAGQQLHQATDHLVSDNQQRGRHCHQQRTAAEADAEQNVEDADHQHEHRHQDDIVRQQLADQRGADASARERPPRPDATATKLRSDRVGRGYRDHHMEHGRQHRSEQELGIVERRVGQDELFGNQSRRRLAGVRDGHGGWGNRR